MAFHQSSPLRDRGSDTVASRVNPDSDYTIGKHQILAKSKSAGGGSSITSHSPQ